MDDYATLEAVKARLDIADTVDDGMISSVISAASRSIDSFCNRLFSQETAQIRYFTADCSGYVDIDDLVEEDLIATDTTGDRSYPDEWLGTDYEFEPFNAARQDWPYTRIVVTPNGTRSFPTIRRGVQITGTWGWPSIPYPVQEACILLTIRWFKRKDSPFGIAGSNELGQVQMMATRDPDVKAMLEPYRKFSVGAF